MTFHLLSMTLAVVLVVTAGASAQKSINDLRPAHAAALKNYLSVNKDVKFRQEDNLGEEYLRDMRKWAGKTLTPNYCVADFNRDKIVDFAVLLYRDGKPVSNGEEGPITEHNPDFPLRLVVFNGSRSGFQVAHTEDLMGPHAAFIRFDKRLYYGIFESDADTFILAPRGKGYIIRFENPM